MQSSTDSIDNQNTEKIDKPLSIAFVVDRFGSRYGGAEAYGVELMRIFAKQGHKITVFARDYDPDCDLKLDYHKISLAKFWPSWVRVLLFTKSAASGTKNKFDIVHSHMNGWCGDIEVVHVTPVRYRWLVRKTNPIKKFLNNISPRIRTYLWLESKRFTKRPGHAVVAVSKLIAAQLNQAYKFADDLPVIPPGVAPAHALTTTDKKDLRLELKLPPDANICLLVARNPIRKGLDTAIRAIAELPADVHLLVVGANAASRNLLEQATNDIQERVHMVSETSNVRPYYQAADIYIHPTLNDSFGMAPLEAMSYSLPVILSPAPWCGFAEYVNADIEALLLRDPKDHKELASLINRINTDPELKINLINGANEVVKRHTWDEVARQYMQLYKKLKPAP